MKKILKGCGLAFFWEEGIKISPFLFKHSFEALLEWVNEELSERTWIYLFATEGATWAEVKEKDDGMLEDKNLVHAFPVVERMRTEASNG